MFGGNIIFGRLSKGITLIQVDNFFWRTLCKFRVKIFCLEKIYILE